MTPADCPEKKKRWSKAGVDTLKYTRNRLLTWPTLVVGQHNNGARSSCTCNWAVTALFAYISRARARRTDLYIRQRAHSRSPVLRWAASITRNEAIIAWEHLAPEKLAASFGFHGFRFSHPSSFLRLKTALDRHSSFCRLIWMPQDHQVTANVLHGHERSNLFVFGVEGGRDSGWLSWRTGSHYSDRHECSAWP